MGPDDRDTAAPGLDEPEGYLVTVGGADRIHFLDWGPATDPGEDRGGRPPRSVLLLHGLAATAWTWAPVARQLRTAHRVIAQDLRGHGLSDAPTAGYRPAELADNALAVAEGAGLLRAGRPEAGLPGILIAGHGFGAIVAAWLARRLGSACGGLVLVDGGWEHPAAATGLEPDELLRSLDEPPEVLRSMDAWLRDRMAFDPPTWDADQERAARAAVVELPAGRVVPVARPHVLAACVEAMYEHRPAEVLAAVTAPIVALVAAEDEVGSRRPALSAVNMAIRAARRPAISVVDLPSAGHNLMRYHPDAVAKAIDALGIAVPAYHRGP